MRLRISLLFMALLLALTACGPDESVRIEHPWTSDDLASALQTVDEWASVWEAQADYAYELTVSHDSEPVHRFEIGADGRVTSEEPLHEFATYTSDERTVEDFFDHMRDQIDGFSENVISYRPAHVTEWEFDPATGAPMALYCYGIDYECVGITLEIAPA